MQEVMNFTARPLHTDTLRLGGWVGRKSGLDVLETSYISLFLLAKIHARFVGRSNRNLVIKRSAISRLGLASS